MLSGEFPQDIYWEKSCCRSADDVPESLGAAHRSAEARGSDQTMRHAHFSLHPVFGRASIQSQQIPMRVQLDVIGEKRDRVN